MNRITDLLSSWFARTVLPTSMLMALILGCRPPQMPILSDDLNVIQYDSAYEEQLRSGKPLRFGLDGMERYVNSLSEPVAVTEWTADQCKWQVFVATNRGCFESPQDPLSANRVLRHAQYGECEVTLPRNDIGLRMLEEEDRKKNQADLVSYRDRTESPAHNPNQARPSSPDVKSSLLTEQAFLDGVRRQVQLSREKDLLVFVHGFNVSFDEAVTETANLALRIPFNGAIVSYSWPSQGGVLNYGVDEPINRASVGPFVEFLKSLRMGIPNAKVHILVHSMGNRIVMESLSRMHRAGESKQFGHIVLCAPDVGAKDFFQWAPGVVALSEKVTLYANASDTALIASKNLHSESRAGDMFAAMIAPGIDTIDCSRIESSILGHSYHRDNDDINSDIFLLIKDNLPPEKRTHLTLERTSNGHYWQFTKHAPNLMCTWHFQHLRDQPRLRSTMTKTSNTAAELR